MGMEMQSYNLRTAVQVHSNAKRHDIFAFEVFDFVEVFCVFLERSSAISFNLVQLDNKMKETNSHTYKNKEQRTKIKNQWKVLISIKISEFLKNKLE